MAALWWHEYERHVSEALSGLGELKTVIGDELTSHGFTDVRVNDVEVAGGKADCWISIAHFHISGRAYWEIVMGSADASDTAESTVLRVAKIIENLKFL